ncbi:hypothetical protein SADUNF_Sadunf02G0042200 [Salix dunnii]|uniref:Inositol polyphosphate-related phosphatase domain-containing protein n=1 Tax=Salix dunnii TaxID=1413687 RepID=A0A835N684_9ROSI|nr:hypothetical protein SADUNF_Sadunf02G0042200 [Salix dunnii]
MRDENPKKSKTLVRKWFNIKSKAEEFQADDALYGGGGEDWRHNFSEREACNIQKSKTERSSKRHSDRVHRSKIELEAAQVTDVNQYRIFVATWNVAGKSPPSHLNLQEWLHTSPPADIYVLGFQEIVPLNAGNVLGTESNGPAKKWLALIRQTLHSLPGTSCGYHTPSPVSDPIVELDADFEGSTRQKASTFFHRRSFQSLSRSMRMNGDMVMAQPRLDRRFSVCDRVIFGNRSSDYDPNFKWGSSDDENGPGDSPGAAQYAPIDNSGSLSMEDRDGQTGQSRYCLVASKQMVGLFLTVWVKSDLRDDIRNLKVSCVGRGLMGYLGNKGSISISMSLHQTSFCFICSHLTSGQKEGDELRRNSDVMEILRKTSRIIWLRIEQRQGRVFDGWNEGKIYFPPTYKYSNNSDRYAGDDGHLKEKRRTPAWGLHQLSYVRGESRFSDHRPVYGVFLAEVESINRSRIKKSMRLRVHSSLMFCITLRLCSISQEHRAVAVASSCLEA